MDKLLFGDNQFFGINHMSEEACGSRSNFAVSRFCRGSTTYWMLLTKRALIRLCVRPMIVLRKSCNTSAQDPSEVFQFRILFRVCRMRINMRTL